MKRVIVNIIFYFLYYIPLFAHSGRTDSNGGHFNRTTGLYHSHNGSSGIFGGLVIVGIILFVVFVNSGKKNKK